MGHVSSFCMLPQYALAAIEVETLCRTAARLFLCLDYDGTLVPITPRPEEARPSPGLLALLSQLARTPHVEVAVVSGRPLSELCLLLPVAGIAYIGTHGLEVRTPGGETRRLLPTGAFITVMARLRQDLQSVVDDTPGCQLEDKRHALAFHYRLARPQEAERAVAAVLSAVHAYQRKGITLEVVHGKKVVEVRPLGVNKGKAVQFLMAHHRNPLPLFCYFGDDATDEDAFRALNGRGLTIAVGDPPWHTSARYYLKNPEEVCYFLSNLLKLRQSVAERI